MLQNEILKFKYMDINSLYRSLDRLTRFKNPDEKFQKVFNSIILDFLIAPKYNLKELEKIEFSKKEDIVKRIWNESVSFICKEKGLKIKKTRKINDLLATEEHQMFNIEKSYFTLDIDIDSLLQVECSLNPVPINILRLLNIKDNVSILELRKAKKLKFPLEKILLVEGITEEILMPVFAEIQRYNFNENGIHLISAGGKNQVARWYFQNKELVKLPIFILLDSDAIEIKQTLETILDSKDKIHIIKNGEFEDIIPEKLIKKTINDTFQNDFNVDISELRAEESMCKSLKQIFHDHHAGDFKKAEFAKQVAEELQKLPCISDEIYKIINELKSL